MSTAVTSAIMPLPYWAAAPESCKSWVTATFVPRPDRLEGRRDEHLRLAPALLVRSARLHDDSFGGFVTLGNMGVAGKAQPDRTHPYGHAALEPIITQVRRSAPRPASMPPRPGCRRSNARLVSTGWATSKSLLISIAPPSVT